MKGLYKGGQRDTWSLLWCCAIAGKTQRALLYLQGQPSFSISLFGQEEDVNSAALCKGVLLSFLAKRLGFLSPLWQCGRFIKRALPAFITPIIKVNPIMILPEILNISLRDVGRQMPGVIDSQHNCVASWASLIYCYFPPLYGADTVLVRNSRASDCHYSAIKVWIIAQHLMAYYRSVC